MGVSRLAHDSEVDEFGRDVGIDDADDESGDDHEREGSLLVRDHAQAAECRGRRILAQVSEANGWGHDEEKGGDAGQDSKSLGEVLWLFHLGDEGWEENLRNPEEADVEDGIHTRNPSRSSRWEGVRFDWSQLGVISTIPIVRSILDTSEDHKQQDRETHAEGREHRHERNVVQGPG